MLGSEWVGSMDPEEGEGGGPDGYSLLWRQDCSQIEMSYCGRWALGLGPPDGREESFSPREAGRQTNKAWFHSQLCSDLKDVLGLALAS